MLSDKPTEIPPASKRRCSVGSSRTSSTTGAIGAQKRAARMTSFAGSVNSNHVPNSESLSFSSLP